ncbi:hypothetical protein SARC_07920 [Sphaeroforma arctica JP610]|uniref:Aminotransferase class I/classII large domain-containing protein n=1 Tax=Sphaeroforma arctica JP610 TaxID=667725 RepID=A0A0L0FUT3_9EUKA|nr:hypothetical protein SARC_07920 [Sphaeroforma arctica JP610]KNC79693.1 hypothetical protein SARC_07920 [Sphaeroforma arctica JP610]|eukprot:XP_014153595.1 hypothetical protein SARC_07920 [Sphaeroforma arctica JP610]
MSDQNAIKEFPIMAVNDSTDGEVKSVTNTLDKLHMQRPKKKFSMTDFNDSQRLLAKKVLTHWKSTIEAHDKMRQENPTFTGKHFRKVPKTGVIYATSRAVEMGYHPDAPDWANMGQGAPECGTLPNQPERLTSVEFDIEHQEYAPVQGLPELCEAVAEHYNQLYRMDSTSKYTKDNVCIIPGGRAGITRVMACLNSLNVGYGVPDYTAYEELLGLFKRINPIPIAKDKGATHVTPAQLEQQILQLGLGGVMVSNPCNPTGHLLEGKRLLQSTLRHDCKGRVSGLGLRVYITQHGYGASQETALTTRH